MDDQTEFQGWIGRGWTGKRMVDYRYNGDTKVYGKGNGTATGKRRGQGSQWSGFLEAQVLRRWLYSPMMSLLCSTRNDVTNGGICISRWLRYPGG